ncbi:Major facilitator superfamily domain, general substrate transporter [Niveomyces insectorum RCEF 264]|uniref:Major facilitator superfamily domain, general substrate transporter n=1 Tax=Niveomyces insectorum RCEF 264 TaxID=1081102 RepID=A0A167P3J9_9HYPO|nr:Major facilitator superfamily domain, general substrate transporter [Niveomyces insectorum RCEF 264]
MAGGASSDLETKGQNLVDESPENGGSHARFDALGSTGEAELPGVVRMEAVNSHLTFGWRCGLYFSMFFVSYAITLNQLVSGTYQGYATSTWDHHSLLSTINVVRGVISAAALPLAAKLSDLVGRVECFVVASVFFVVGSIIQAAAQNIQAFATGSLLTQIGYTSVQLLVEIVVSDTTSLRSRLFFLFFPSFPNLINVWVSGNITSSILEATTWRWGYGMWCIIYPVCAAPFIIVLVMVGRGATKKDSRQGPSNQTHFLRLSASEMHSKLDLIGLFLLTAALSLLLIPMTLAGGETQKWKTAGIITPVVLGAIFLPLFLFWESKAAHPLLPYSLFKDRSVWAAIGIAFFGAASYTTQSDFLFTVLLVGYDFSIEAATRVSVISSFMEAAGGILGGAVIYKFRRGKLLIIAGCVVWFVSYGLMYHYRGGSSGANRAGIIAGQVLVGTATSLVTFPNIIIAMALARHEDIAVLTSLWLAMNWAGFAVGNCVSGAIWTQTLYGQLQRDLGPVNATLVDLVYAEPLYVVPEYPVGTPERTAIIVSYKYIQKLLTLTGLGFVIPAFFFAFCLRNPKMKGYFVTASV